MEYFFGKWLFFFFSFCLVNLGGNLFMPISNRLNILATIFLITKIETPYTSNSIISKLNQMMACRNAFTNRRIKLNYMPNKLKIPTWWTDSISLLTIHRWNFSISKKIIFPLLERVITIFSLFLSSRSNSNATWLPFGSNFKLSPLPHLFYQLFANASSHLHQQEIGMNFYSLTILKKKENLSG